MRGIYFILFLFSLNSAILAQVKDPLLLGKAEMDKGQYSNAIKIFTEALSYGSSTGEILLNLGQCHYQVGNYNSAIHYFLLAENRQKNIASYWLARSYAMTDRNDSAIIYLRANLLSGNKIPESTIKLDPAFSNLENTVAWKNIWKEEWYNEFEVLLAEIKYLTDQKEYMEALDLIDQNLAKYAQRNQLFGARGRIFLELNNLSSAITAFTRAIEINGTQPEYYISRAKAYSGLRKYDLAVSDLIKALDIEPDNFPLYFERSRLYDLISNYNRAMDDIDFYIKLFPDDIQAMFFKGQIYYDQANYLKALEIFNKCLSKDQSEADFFVARANTYLKTNTFKYAIQDYGMALDLDPRNPDTYLNRGLARFNLNDKKGACNDWEKAARLGSAKAVEMLNKHCHGTAQIK
jgi:tetratricopeptide (TPR) repeat protein